MGDFDPTSKLDDRTYHMSTDDQGRLVVFVDCFITLPSGAVVSRPVQLSLNASQTSMLSQWKSAAASILKTQLGVA